jgi:phage shock protein PspC (stress-responsive transcriptional regulator)
MNNKKLYRNTNQQMFAGVCSGLADYFGLDVTVVRLIFVLLFFLGGHGVLVYLLLWILTPAQPSFIESTARDVTPKQDE